MIPLAQDAVVRRRSLHTLNYLIADVSTHQLMSKVGVVAMLASITVNPEERSDILEPAVDALGALCFTFETAEQVARFGGVAAMVDILKVPGVTKRLQNTTFRALVALAHTPVEDVQYKAAGAMRDLSVNDFYQKAIVAFKAVEVLIKLLLEGAEPTKGQAAGAIRTLALNGFNRLYINKEKGVHALCAALYEKSTRLQTQVVGALWNLTHEPRCVEVMVEMEIAERLVYLAQSPYDEVKELAVGLVRSLSLLDAGVRKEVVARSKHSILHKDTTEDCNTGGRFLEPEIFAWKPKNESFY